MSQPGSLAPVVRESTVSQVARELRTAIMRGDLAPGAQLIETTLADQLKVSRGPLREAIQRLVQEGLVRTELNRGVFVAELGDDDVRDIYRARATVEHAAVTAILEHDPHAAADALEEHLRQMYAAVDDDDRSALTDADLAFHQALVELSGSPRLRRMHETLLVETHMCIAAANTTYSRPADALKEHLAVVEAIRSGDLAAVRAAIDDHMDDALRRLVSDASITPPRG